MTTTELGNIMSAKGYGYGRYKSGIYYYTNMFKTPIRDEFFTGTYQEFVRFALALPNARG